MNQRANHVNHDRVQSEVTVGGLLTYLQNPEDAQKVANMTGSDGKPVIAFMKDGQYQTGPGAIDANSVQQVRVTINGQEQYFRRIAASDPNSATAFKASAWVKTDAAGQVQNGECDVTLCYGGYNGGMPPSAASREGAPVAAVLSGQLNSQVGEVKNFTDSALAAAGSIGTVTAVHNYAHSAGAANGMLSNAIVAKKYTSDAVLVEPLRARDQAGMLASALADPNNPIAPGLSLSGEDLTRNTTSVNAARTGSDGILRRAQVSTMFLGNGVGTQMLVNMDNSPAGADGSAISTAITDHRANNISLDLINNGGQALRAAGVTAAPQPQQQAMGFGGNNIGELIMSLISSLVSGQGSLMDMMQGLTQGTQLAGVSQTNPNTAAGSGVRQQSFLGVNVGRG